MSCVIITVVSKKQWNYCYILSYSPLYNVGKDFENLLPISISEICPF